MLNVQSINLYTEAFVMTDTHESITQGDLRLHGGRAHVSFRCRPEVWRAFSEFAKTNDITTCHILEACITAYLEGMHQKIEWVTQSPTINLNLVREVKRVRRYAVGFGEGVCHFCGSDLDVRMFTYVKTGKVYPVCEFHSKELLESKLWK